ncbi:excinuclease ABC subunit UvrA [Candidatus Mycoplasma mahonii]|uniref:excinuclease ABC subunit UvrA n=1 Tax=Candidatus Mycoplasma mahonii TaxID=3004105 RepID=UPI0026EA8C4B|nr:excinuclease ABC subunit UvrA [Candidatus Mycoplasma mahonii]WKX02439.1 excinuclease ABC subunit UvrA [Candidatus Mycoplasma mahonii]
MKETTKYIIVKGAKENNLKNIDVKIPKDKMVVFTGVSGSGKSSLAFDTIYEEGRRRYVDSLSSYARQFLGGTQKPLVDSIEGLSPAISIEQKTTHNNPRSTVGTVTEIYDYIRLLYARIGTPFCPVHNIKISAQRSKDIINSIYKNKESARLIILAPIVRAEKGIHSNLFEKLKRDGFLRIRVNGTLMTLEDEIKLDKNKKHNVEIVVDRIILKEEERSRISEAIELALEYGKGLIIVNVVGVGESSYSKYHSCPHGDFDMPLIEPRLFSFNAPAGMCTACKGLGVKLNVDVEKLMPNEELSINEGGIVFFKNLVGSENIDWQQFKILMDHYNINLDKKIEYLSKKEIKIIMEGATEDITYKLITSSGNMYKKTEKIEGIATKIERRHLNSNSERIRKWIRDTFMSDVTCKVCRGKRLNEHALAVKVNKIDIHEFTQLSVTDALEFIIKLKLSKEEVEISTLIINEVVDRLSFLVNVGLEYLTLDRKAETLSGGESQRIRLATQIGSNLTGVLYVLDEPSIGLHQKDNKKLIETLKKMVEIGNTLIIVEHDEETIRSADFIIDIGPKAGDAGGEVVAAGTVKEISDNKYSITGDFLSGRNTISTPKNYRSGNGKVIEIKGASENNLQNISVKFPLGKLIAVTGVSGSGKSSLVNEILGKSLQKQLTNPFLKTGAHKNITGMQNIDKVIQISQSPIGRTPRSNPATYTSVFDDIRDLFTQTQLSRARGYQRGRFSFNVDGGRCDKCRGGGSIKIEMHFLPNVYVMCDHCDGKRYNRETLEAKYKNKSIADVLNMRVHTALKFFENRPKIKFKLQALDDVGLNYITLGQSATTLSGGEAQRVKLATFLLKKPTGKTMYILDEPTTGLHQFDVQKLLVVLNRIVDGGDTVLVIEHNLDVIKTSDYIIDLGPGGGINGGRVVAAGTPQQVAKNKDSFTGMYLKDIFGH